MNRAERRKYEKSVRNDKRASKCPKCGLKALFYTKAVLKPGIEKEADQLQKEDFDTQICCEACNAVIYEGEEVSKLVPPGVYLPLPLDIVDYALRHPEITDDAETERIVDELNKIPN